MDVKIYVIKMLNIIIIENICNVYWKVSKIFSIFDLIVGFAMCKNVDVQNCDSCYIVFCRISNIDF